MSMLNQTSSPFVTTGAVAGAIKSAFATIRRAVSATAARLIAQREYEASLHVLRCLSDRELMDMGLNRTQIGEGLKYAGKDRAALQEASARLSMMA